MPQVVDAQFTRQFLDRLHGAAYAYDTHDAKAVAALCCTDVAWEDPAAQHRLQGRDAVQCFHSDIMFRSLPDTRIELSAGPYLALDGTCMAAHLCISDTMTSPLAPRDLRPAAAA